MNFDKLKTKLPHVGKKWRWIIGITLAAIIALVIVIVVVANKNKPIPAQAPPPVYNNDINYEEPPIQATSVPYGSDNNNNNNNEPEIVMVPGIEVEPEIDPYHAVPIHYVTNTRFKRFVEFMKDAITGGQSVAFRDSDTKKCLTRTDDNHLVFTDCSSQNKKQRFTPNIKGANYSYRAYATNQCLGVVGNNVQLVLCDGTMEENDPRLWSSYTNRQGYFPLKNVKQNLCLGPIDANGPKLVPCYSNEDKDFNMYISPLEYKDMEITYMLSKELDIAPRAGDEFNDYVYSL